MKLRIALLCIIFSLNLINYTFAQKNIGDYRIQFSSTGTEYNYQTIDLSILFGIYPNKENIGDRLNTKVTVFKIERPFLNLGKREYTPRKEPQYPMKAIFHTTVKELLQNGYKTFTHKVPGSLYDSIFTITLKVSVFKSTSTIKIEIESIKETLEFNPFLKNIFNYLLKS